MDIFTINNKHYLCIEDFHKKYLAIKQVEGPSTENLIHMQDYPFLIWATHENGFRNRHKLCFREIKKNFSRSLSIHNMESSSYYYQGNKQAEACIDFSKEL